MAKRLPPIPTEVLGTGTKILEKDGIRASLSYAYSRGARVALGRMRDQVVFRLDTARKNMNDGSGASYWMGRVESYEYDLDAIDNMIKEYAHEA
jgi:hypothetical protein